ncbi:TetR/AcrR family transcriptional regulator [Ralstonia sp. SM1864_UCD524_TZ4]|uniref:Transcription regulator protein n=2 Tax=Ralstonia solanacearum species complex TaxID=3116862 RepID=A0A0S4VXF6_RALSL|nr:TetR/AcrR family transcriptional regulator [Ralstonia pseudosolanacearum]CUV23948.1 Transcription regulator protein [Ralstonia solanacearum]CUV37427.1 Transcription regulator protein [Ralstonia solanacearum]CUV39236.1 Transcription regulator protein [Ralstonia solanacearum]CUV61029.1 Transcription regulator protein [Ralstonia solanacearum]
MARPGAGDTKNRILEATELLFIEFGYEAMSLRQITARAKVNLAAVNYHFGSKEALMQSVLGRRLDPLNTRRLALLTACEERWPQRLSCEHVLGALFVPALQMARTPDTGGPAFLRLMGRVYSDTSPFVQNYLLGHYAPVFDRFFEAFSRTLPGLPRAELGWRLHFALKALAGVLAGDDLNNLLPLFTQGKPMNDATLLARLTALVVATLNAPLPGDEAGALDQVVELAEVQPPASTAPADDDSTGNGGGADRGTERAGSPPHAAPFSGDPFGRTAASRADAGAARHDTADDDSDNVDGSSTAPQATPSARTRALAIRRSNAARAIFPANPMRPWRSPGA